MALAGTGLQFNDVAMVDSMTPHRYSVRATATGEGVGRVVTKTQTIEFDRSWGGEPSTSLPGPAELLAAALAACVIKNIERFSQVLPFSYQSAEIDVTVHRQDRPPRFDRIEYVVQMVTNEELRKVDLLGRNLAKYGTVYNTLAASCEIRGRIETSSNHVVAIPSESD